MKKAISFKNSRGLALCGFVIEPKDEQNKENTHKQNKQNKLKINTAIIFLHGFPGHCQGFTGTRVLKAIAQTNYLLLVFDFSHTDTSDGKFEDKLMSREAEDIRSAIDFLDEKYDYQQLVLIGISTGAIGAALYAHRDKRIDKLVLLGGVSDLQHAVHYDFTDQQVHDFWTKGHIRYHRPGEWYHHKKLKKAFYDEFFTLDIPTAIRKWKRPLLVVHGELDEAVPLQDGEELFAMANKPKKLAIIRGADHRFTKLWHFIRVLKIIDQFIRS